MEPRPRKSFVGVESVKIRGAGRVSFVSGSTENVGWPKTTDGVLMPSTVSRLSAPLRTCAPLNANDVTLRASRNVADQTHFGDSVPNLRPV